jgi:hypothetical protein
MNFTTSSPHYSTTPAVSITSPLDNWPPYTTNYAGLHLNTEFTAYPSYPASDQSPSPMSSGVENDSHSSENMNDLSPSINLRPRSQSQESRESHQSVENLSPSSMSIQSAYVKLGLDGYSSSSDRGEYVNVHLPPDRVGSPFMEICTKLETPSSPDSDSSYHSVPSAKGKQKKSIRKGKNAASGGFVEFSGNNHVITIKQVLPSRIEKKPAGGRTKGQKLPEEIAANARHMRKVGSCWSCLFMRETVSITHPTNLLAKL